MKCGFTCSWKKQLERSLSSKEIFINDVGNFEFFFQSKNLFSIIFNHKKLFQFSTNQISRGVQVTFVILMTYLSNSSQFIQSMIPLTKSNQKWIFCVVTWPFAISLFEDILTMQNLSLTISSLEMSFSIEFRESSKITMAMTR